MRKDPTAEIFLPKLWHDNCSRRVTLLLRERQRWGKQLAPDHEKKFDWPNIFRVKPAREPSARAWRPQVSVA
jgi:hypothetical protein